MTRSFLRGLCVLEAAARSPLPLGIQQIAEITGLDKATTMRLLRTLRDAGYLTQDMRTKAFALTDKLSRLAAGAAGDQDLRDCARAPLIGLRESTGETIHLGILRNDRVVYIDKLESSRSIRLVSAIGQEMPLHSTGLGKAILAALPDAERELLLRRLTLARRTDQTITSSSLLAKELAAIRRRGWALDNSENEENTTCVAAALTDSTGRLVGAISVAGPTFRVAIRRKQIATEVLCAAARIQEAIQPGVKHVKAKASRH